VTGILGGAAATGLMWIKAFRLPWKKRHFLRHVAEIKTAAGIDPEIKFMSLRHGGNTEGADANLTDARMRAERALDHRSATEIRANVYTAAQRRSGTTTKRQNERWVDVGMSQ
jgi:hypothetical protein